MDEFRLPRSKMIDWLRGHYKIGDERVLTAMSNVPRHLFVPEALRAQAYTDNAVPMLAGQTVSQPFIVARMTELLEVSERSRVLEIGAGSGYQTAILATLAGEVYAVERIKELFDQISQRLRYLKFRNVYLRCADGTNGWEAGAPFDAILVAAGAPEIPAPLVAQLKIGGKLVIPIGTTQASQVLTRVIRKESGFVRENHGSCAFVPLIGQHGWKK